MQAAIPMQKSFLGQQLNGTSSVRAARPAVSCTIVASGGKKTDPNQVGIKSVVNDVVRNNLLGVSRTMEKKGWVDSQGQKGKGYGVYKFAKKYGTNVDGYSPIYTPDSWSSGGGSYKLGVKGLIAWAGLVAVILVVGVGLIVSTSAL